LVIPEMNSNEQGLEQRILRSCFISLCHCTILCCKFDYWK